MMVINEKSFSGLVVAALLFVIVFACYLNSLNNDFIWDDNTVIVRNDAIKDISNISGIIFAEDTTEDIEHTGLYRPLTYFSYALDYFVWGLNPTGFRLVNIFFHFASALIIYYLAMLLFGDKPLSFSAAALFAVHPVHVESVSFIAARGSELSGFYYLLSFFFFIKYRVSGDAQKSDATGIKAVYQKYRYLFFSSTAFIISFMAKEYAITLFIVMAAYDLAYFENVKRQGVRVVCLTYMPYIALTGMWFVARKIATDGARTLGMLAEDIMNGQLILRLIDAVRLIMRSIGLLIFPNALSAEYIFKPTESLLSINLLVAVALTILMVYYTCRQFRRNRPLFIAIVLFLAPLTLTLGIIPLKGESYLADRWLYIPAAGFLLIVAYYLSAFVRRAGAGHNKAVPLAMAVTIALFFSYKTVERNRVFKDELSLWSDTEAKAPNSFKAHLNLGYALYKKGRQEDALSEYKQALVQNPVSAKAKYNVAVYYQNIGDYEQAVIEYEGLIANGKSFFDVMYNLAECYEKSGDRVEALINYKRAFTMLPGSLKALKKLSTIYHELNDEESAKRYNKLYEMAKSSK